MADNYIKHIEKNADLREVIKYLDYLADRLSYILENIDTENFTDQLNSKIGG